MGNTRNPRPPFVAGMLACQPLGQPVELALRLRDGDAGFQARESEPAAHIAPLIRRSGFGDAGAAEQLRVRREIHARRQHAVDVIARRAVERHRPADDVRILAEPACP